MGDCQTNEQNSVTSRVRRHRGPVNLWSRLTQGWPQHELHELGSTGSSGTPSSTGLAVLQKKSVCQFHAALGLRPIASWTASLGKRDCGGSAPSCTAMPSIDKFEGLASRTEQSRMASFSSMLLKPLMTDDMWQILLEQHLVS